MPANVDIVERLRITKEWVAFPAVPICLEAADEIERLREQVASLQASSGYEASISQLEIERLRAALVAFDKHFGPLENNHMLNEEVRECFRLAREALLVNQCRKDDDQDNIDRQHKGPSVK